MLAATSITAIVQAASPGEFGPETLSIVLNILAGLSSLAAVRLWKTKALTVEASDLRGWMSVDPGALRERLLADKLDELSHARGDLTKKNHWVGLSFRFLVGAWVLSLLLTFAPDM